MTAPKKRPLTFDEAVRRYPEQFKAALEQHEAEVRQRVVEEILNHGDEHSKKNHGGVACCWPEFRSLLQEPRGSETG